MNDSRKDWITTGLTIMSAIIVFRVVSGLVEAAWFFLRKIPYQIAMQVHSFGFVVIPAVSIAIAVLLCRWHEAKLASARRKTRIGILLILTVVALFPMRIQMKAEMVMPSPEQLEALGIPQDEHEESQPSPGAYSSKAADGLTGNAQE